MSKLPTDSVRLSPSIGAIRFRGGSTSAFSGAAAAWFRKVFVFVALYVILYSPTLTATQTGLARPLVLLGLTVALVSELCRSPPRWQVPFATIVGCVGLMVALALSQSLALLHGGDLFLRGVTVSVFSGLLPLTYLIVRFAPDTPSSLEALARSLARLGALQSVLILADWWSPAVRTAMAAIVMQPDNIDSGFRAAGLTSMTGDGLSVSQAICAVCAIHLAVIQEHWRSALGWACALVGILATMVFVGRTGFVLIAVFTVYLAIVAPRRKRILVGAAFVIALFAGAVAAISLSIDDDRLANLFDQATASAFEVITGFEPGTGLHTESTDDLATMIVLPHSIETWAIGDGYYSNPASADANYMGTDIGYLRMLFYVGAIGSAAIYSWYCCVAFWSARRFRRRSDSVLGVGLVLCFFVSQMKFNFLLLLAPLALASLIFFSAIHDQRRCA